MTDTPPPDDSAPTADAEQNDDGGAVPPEQEDDGAPVPAEQGDDDDAPVAGRGRRRLVVVAAALVLVVAGGVVAWQVLTPDPRDVANDYFARLAAGDATGALRAIDKSSLGADLPTYDPLLSDAALQDPASRPQRMRITRVAQHGDTATMTVQYQANGASVTQTLKAQRRGRGFALESPLVRLSFTNLAMTDKARVTVNGVAVDATKGGPAFPGAYTAAVDGNALFAGRSTFPATPSEDGTATVVLPPPSLSADGRAKANAAIAAALQQCAVNQFEPQPVCPEVGVFQPGAFGSGPRADVPIIKEFPAGTVIQTTLTGDIKASVTRVPTCTYTADANSIEQVSFAGADGVVHWDVKLIRADGTLMAENASDVTIAPGGRITLDADGRLQVAFA